MLGGDCWAREGGLVEIRVGDSGFAGVLESLSRGREGKGRWG